MEFIELVDSLKGSTKASDKLYWLDYYLKDPKDGPYLCYLMQEAFDPKKLHQVKLKSSDIPTPGKSHLGLQKETISQLFDLLPTSHSSQENKSRVKTAMEVLTRDDQEALMGIVNKKLRCGVGIKQINKVVEDLIPVQEIQLAKKYIPGKNYPGRWWYVSMKLDGQRVFAIHTYTHGWRLYSRDGDYLGREITTLDHWKLELAMLQERTGVTFVDGEAYKHGLTFEQIQSLVSSRVNVKDASELKYNIFYMGRPQDGDLKSLVLLGVPPDQLHHAFKDSTSEAREFHYLEALQQDKIPNNQDVIYERLDKAVGLRYEGIILRSDAVWYEFKRSHALVKVKASDVSGTEIEVDCYVEDIEYGDFQIREHGVESNEYLPVRLLVVINDDKSTLQMGVGTGFSLPDRRAWKFNEQLIVGKVIEVRCQGYGAQGRMRFPRFLRTREDL